jgi:photosystem II stability/assembly factor-like uncharacterized protein
VGGLPTNRTVNGFAVDPTNATVMYVAMRDGFFTSTDAGTSWRAVGHTLKNLAAVAVHPTRPREVYVSTMDGAIFRSTDSGATWSPSR